MSEDLSCADMLQRLRAGDPDAATQVFQRYVHRLIGLARNRLHERARRKAGAEDVVQSALQSFFLHHAIEVDLQSENSLWEMLLRITLRHCGKWNKRFRAQKRAAGEVSIHAGRDEAKPGWELSDDEPTPEEAVALADLVEHLMGGLTPRQRHVFQLRLNGYSVAEISGQIQLSESLVYRIIEQVRAHVGKEMSDK